MYQDTFFMMYLVSCIVFNTYFKPSHPSLCLYNGKAGTIIGAVYLEIHVVKPAKRQQLGDAESETSSSWPKKMNKDFLIKCV